jgi:hypothetical protein
MYRPTPTLTRLPRRLWVARCWCTATVGSPVRRRSSSGSSRCVHSAAFSCISSCRALSTRTLDRPRTPQVHKGWSVRESYGHVFSCRTAGGAVASVVVTDGVGAPSGVGPWLRKVPCDNSAARSPSEPRLPRPDASGGGGARPAHAPPSHERSVAHKPAASWPVTRACVGRWFAPAGAARSGQWHRRRARPQQKSAERDRRFETDNEPS